VKRLHYIQRAYCILDVFELDANTRLRTSTLKPKPATPRINKNNTTTKARTEARIEATAEAHTEVTRVATAANKSDEPPTLSQHFKALPNELRDKIYQYLCEDPKVRYMIRRSTKPSHDCFPCYRRGYDAAAWTPDFFNLVNHGAFASMFIRYYPDFEIEGPHNLVDFLEYDIFKSGVKIKDKCLGALRVRIFIGGPNNLEFVHPQDVKEYLNRLHEAKLSSKFKLHIQLWARHDSYRLGCICPSVISSPIRVQNKDIAAGVASQLQHLKAFREAFEAEAERGTKLSMRVTFSTMGDKEAEALAFEIPEAYYSGGCVNGETWLKIIREQLYEMAKRKMQSQRPRRDSGVEM
jgi:hypothetical protein